MNKNLVRELLKETQYNAESTLDRLIEQAKDDSDGALRKLSEYIGTMKNSHVFYSIMFDRAIRYFELASKLQSLLEMKHRHDNCEQCRYHDANNALVPCQSQGGAESDSCGGQEELTNEERA